MEEILAERREIMALKTRYDALRQQQDALRKEVDDARHAFYFKESCPVFLRSPVWGVLARDSKERCKAATGGALLAYAGTVSGGGTVDMPRNARRSIGHRGVELWNVWRISSGGWWDLGGGGDPVWLGPGDELFWDGAVRSFNNHDFTLTAPPAPGHESEWMAEVARTCSEPAVAKEDVLVLRAGRVQVRIRCGVACFGFFGDDDAVSLSLLQLVAEAVVEVDRRLSLR